ncbi:MAG: DUF2461 domain-containing protein [Pseudomonadota bacterium]
MATWFTKETFEFLRDLRKNNNKPWFEANKDRYLETVRDPFLAFIKDFNPRLKTISEHYHGVEKGHGGALFRIYRDTRFSKDKTPYKTWAGARFTHTETGRQGAPLYYLHLAPDNVFVAAGIWRPPTPMALKIRTFMANNPRAWQKATSDTSFRRLLDFGGEQLKRAPRGFDPEHPLVDDLRRKDFVVVANLTEAQATGSRFAALVHKRYEAAAGFMDYLCAALDLEF